jgi:GT2 family glycosyltransferase
LGNVSVLENTLASVLANRPDDTEIFVVLLRPYEDPYDVKSEVRFVRGDPRDGVVGALNLGIQLASAPVIHTLLCGTEVEEGWAEPAVARLANPRIAAVAPLVLDDDHPSRIMAAGLAYHVGGEVIPLAAGHEMNSLALNVKRVLAPHPSAAFYRKSAVEAFGGFDPAVGDRLAGIDAGLTLEQLGWVTVMEPGSRVLASHRSVPRAGAFRRAVEAERLFWRWAPILGRGRSVAAHALLTIGEAARGILNLSVVPRTVGRFTGACLALAAPSHRRRLAQLRAELEADTPRSLRAAQARPKNSFRISL